jgi:mono/diheme cytochrome c family protein
MKPHPLRIIPALAIVLVAATPLAAQEQPVTFTAAQAERGQSAYRNNCQDCHGSSLDNGEFGGPPLKGGYFRGRWGTGNASVLFGMLSAAMPPDRPGQLSPQTYADLMAFILSHNGYPAGDKEFPADASAQQQMTLKR